MLKQEGLQLAEASEAGFRDENRENTEKLLLDGDPIFTHTCSVTAERPPVLCEHPDPIADLLEFLMHSRSFFALAS